MIKPILSIVFIVLLSGCVSAPESKPEQIRVVGALVFKEPTLLPRGSKATVAIIDVDKPGLIVSQTTFPIAKLPAPYFFSIPDDQLDDQANYVVWATVKLDGQPYLQTFERFPVINNDRFNVSVLLKGVE